MASLPRNAPAKARSRPVSGTGRLLNCQLAGDSSGNTTTTIRLQRLAAVVGITGVRAELIAGLAWGDTHHG